jgi:predicted alpha/beta-hydrolase family hydrolase
VARLAGLVLICYPLHPPGKPENLRVEHLPSVEVPCLFVSGTRDPFGSPDELQEWTATIPAHVEHVWIESGRHDLKGSDDLIADAIADFVSRLVSVDRG